jgi:hypothetical protein
MKQTMKEEGYKFIKWLGNKETVFQEIETGSLEIFFANKNHASWGFNWRGTDWEFSSDYTGQLGDKSKHGIYGEL